MFRTRGGISVAVAAVLILTACGRSTGSGGSSAGSGTDITSGKATGAITVWAQGAEADSLPELLKDFKTANPGVTVNVTAIPWSAAHDKYQAAIAAGTTPDLGQMGTTWMEEFGKAGAFDPTPKNFSTAGFYSGAVASTQVAGGTYGIPWYVDTPVLYYRTDLAAKAGFTGPPATWDQLKAMAAAMQSKAGAKYGIGLPPKDFQAFLPIAWSNGAKLTSDDGKKWTINTPAMVDAVKYYQSFFTAGIANKTPDLDTGAYEAAFVNGSVPMFIGGPAEVGTIKQAGGADFASKYATAVMPKQKSSTSFIGGADLVVFKNSKNRDSAWKLAQYLSTAEVQTTWYTKTGDLPAVQSAWQQAPLNTDSKLAVFGQQLKSVDSPPSSTSWAQVQAEGSKLMEQVNANGLDPAQAMKSLQATADSIGLEN